MDLSTPTLEAPAGSVSGEHGKQAAKRLFGNGDTAVEYVIDTFERTSTGSRRSSGSPVRRNAILFGGVAAVGLLIYGSFHLPAPNQRSVTSELPPVSRVEPINLPPPDLLRPISPEEAAKENAERPFVNRPDTAASRFVLKTDTEDRARALTCLAQAVYYEAAGEGLDGGRAVAQVVLNRLRHPGYPSTVCGVVYEGADRMTGCQFSFTCDGSMQRIPVPSLWNRSREIAQQALAGHVFAPIGHATHYHADYVLPYWADSLDKSVQIGRHIFYRLRSSLGDSRSFFQRYGGTEPEVRQPGATVVIPPGAVPEQLANALISDDLNGSVREVEKAAAKGSSALRVDSSQGALLADARDASTPAHRPKSSADCPVTTDRKQITALSANDMRASTTPSGC